MCYNNIDYFREEAKVLISKGKVSVEEARYAASTRIKEIQEEAERKCKILRERHNEHEILLGKLLAMIDSHSKRLKNSEKVFDEHDDMIRNIVQYTGERFEDFEMNANKIKENNISLDNKIEGKLKNLDDEVDMVKSRADHFKSDILKLKRELQNYIIIFAMLPLLGVFLLYFWISCTLSVRILAETKPSFEHLQLNLDQLKKGIESKVAILESDTVSEIRMSKKAISSIDKNLEQRFEIFIQKFQQELTLHEIQLENFEKRHKDDIKETNEELSNKLTQMQHETFNKITEATSVLDEFMIPKLWLNKVNSKDPNNKSFGSALGMFKEDGKENEKPLYRQINGNWIIYFNKENKLILSNQEEVQEEIFLQLNSKLPELTSDKWKYPSHKVNIVHSVPCCKTLIIKHLKLQGMKMELQTYLKLLFYRKDIFIDRTDHCWKRSMEIS